MVLDINLITKQVAELKKRRRTQWLIQIVSFVALVVFLVISSAVLSYFYFLKSQIGNLEKQINQKKDQVKSLQAKETKVVYLDRKLDSLSLILKAQAVNQEKIEAIFSLVPEGVSIESLKFISEGLVELEGSAVDLLNLQEFFSNINKASGDSLVLTNSEVIGVEHDRGSGYSFKMIIKFQGDQV